jgi:hypothetical protein
MPASVTSILKVSNSALKTRAVRDGLREKIRADVEGKLLRRAIIAPQEPDVTDARVDVSETINTQRRNVTDRGLSVHKKHLENIGEMLWIFRSRRCAICAAMRRNMSGHTMMRAPMDQGLVPWMHGGAHN